jgi:hypothetical protein
MIHPFAKIIFFYVVFSPEMITFAPKTDFEI